jgi:NodT family efflux transporter outer membrane factor (OMF) lipoprotein
MRRWIPLLLAAALTGVARAAPVEVEALVGAAYSVGQAPPVPDDPWWTRLGDPRLAAYVDEALGGNRDLARSRAAVRQVEGARLGAVSPLVPSLNAVANTQIAPLETLGFGFGLPQDPTAPKTYALGGAALEAGLQVDPFGGSLASLRAAGADVRAARDDLGDASASIAVLVAEAYLDVVAAAERVDVVEAQIAMNRDLLEVLELRYARGDAGVLDVLQQRQQLASTEAQLPTARLLFETAGQRLAVLLGRSPTALPEAGERLPEVDQAAPIGAPSDLVAHRPDLRAASERASAAQDRRWAATTALLPKIGLSGKAGWQYIDRGDFVDQTYWNAGGSVTLPIFNGGRAAGGIQQARAAADAQTAAFEGLLLTAVQQVEAAVAREQRQREAVVALEAQLTAADQAWVAAREQYLAGLTPFLNVQSALGRRQAAELALVQGRRDLLSARVAVGDAVGGPWTLRLGADAPMGQ